MDNRKKKRGKTEGVTGIVFILCLVVVLVINLIVPDREKSGKEDRNLASFPAFSVESLLTGDFAEGVETYLKDQFAGRDLLRSLRVSLGKIGGNRLENGVYLGKNGQLLEDIQVPDSANLAANLEAIRSFAQSGQDIRVTMMLVPDAACILSDSLPAFASVEDQTQLFGMVQRQMGDSVTWIDTVSILNKYKNEKIYDKTDDRWTTLGAFYAFQESAQALGITDSVAEQFASYAVSGSFNGDLAAQCGAELGDSEEIDIYVPTLVDDDVVVTYVDEAQRTTSLYDSAALGTEPVRCVPSRGPGADGYQNRFHRNGKASGGERFFRQLLYSLFDSVFPGDRSGGSGVLQRDDPGYYGYLPDHGRAVFIQRQFIFYRQ